MFKVLTFDNDAIGGTVYYNHLKYIVDSQFKASGVNKINYHAAAPADLRLSYAGSGLPFATEDMAMFGTPNQGLIETDKDGKFRIELYAPNSYYINQGTILIPPQVYLTTAGGKSYTIDLGPSIPNRSLTSLPGNYIRATGR
jgi:hypothetical protein